MDNLRLGNFIAQRRKALGLTQKDLAQQLHVTDKAVSKWETVNTSPQNPYVELHAADQVVRQTVDYSRARKKKTKGQKFGILLLLLVIVYLGCITYDNFVPGKHYFASIPAEVYEADGSISDKVKVIFHGKLKNCLLPFYMDDFVGTVSMKLPEMETGEQVYI